jgi:glycosyltransferase involved in cell wall biosynthesis
MFINARFLEENRTGVGRFAFEVTKRFVKYFPDATIIAPKNSIIPLNWKVSVKGFHRGAFWEQFQFPFLISRNQSWCFNPANTSSLLLRNNVTVIHDIIPITNPEWYSLQARIYYRILLPLVIRNAKLLITVSEATKKDIHKHIGIPLEKIHVAGNAVDEFWHKVEERPTIDNYILTVGSLDPRKNLKRIIESFLILEDNSLNLVVVGHKHKAFANLDISIPEQDSKRIIFTGFVTDEEIRSLYSHAKVFVYVSLKEGFGIPPLEAMRCECPVVASDIEVLREVCSDAALYVNPLDSLSISQGIKHLLDNNNISNALIKKGVVRSRFFNWDEISEKIARLLKSQS